MTEREKEFKQAVGDLAGELATMHATLFNLIHELRKTDLTRRQSAVIDVAHSALHQSQRKFFITYADMVHADMVGGRAPDRN